MKNKYVIISIAVIMFGLMIAGGTYAYLTRAATVTEGNYAGSTTCFNIDYSINNVGSGQDITGTLFPSATPQGGLTGKVAINVNATCTVSGTGSLTLHVNTATMSRLTTKATAACYDKITNQVVSNYQTESTCVNAGKVWRYPDSYCEDKDTLEYLKDYRTSGECTSHNGTWTTSGSALKYAIYGTNDTSENPLAVGHFSNSNIGNDVIVYDNFTITHDVKNLYIYVWLDGYLADDTFSDLTFDGYIRAGAIQGK